MASFSFSACRSAVSACLLYSHQIVCSFSLSFLRKYTDLFSSKYTFYWFVCPRMNWMMLAIVLYSRKLKDGENRYGRDQTSGNGVLLFPCRGTELRSALVQNQKTFEDGASIAQFRRKSMSLSIHGCFTCLK